MPVGDNSGSIYRGSVVHQRLRPTQHKLKYRVFSLFLDVDKLENTAKKLKLFSVNRFNLFSLKEKSHGHRNATSLSSFAWGIVDNCRLSHRVASIKMLFYPRILGFAFNPLTVYFCLDEDGLPVLMIYEVRNTFGENLTYVLPAGEDHNGTFVHETEKQFYVSPFNDVEGRYTFHATRPASTMTVGVALRTQGKPLLRTHFRGASSPLSDGELLKAFFSYPLMTLKVVAGIHWEALKLWRKGMRLKDQPAPPPDRVVFSDPS